MIIAAHNSAFILYKLNYEKRGINRSAQLLEKTFMSLFSISDKKDINLNELYSSRGLDMDYKSIREVVRYRFFLSKITGWDVFMVLLRRILRDLAKDAVSYLTTRDTGSE